MPDYGVEDPGWEPLPWAWAAERLGTCGPRARKARNLLKNPQVVVATESTVECLSIEGRARPLLDEGARATWTDRYLAKYRPLSPEISAAFLDANAMFEVSPERAFGVIEREQEFAGRATRWVFDPA